MNRKVKANTQMIQRVVTFVAAHQDQFPRNTAAPELQLALDSAAHQLSEQSIAQLAAEAAIRTSRNARTAARTELRTRMILADQVARALNNDRFHTPVNAGDPTWIDAGRAFLVDMESLEKVFTQHGLPPDKLLTAIQALEQARHDLSVQSAKRSAAIHGCSQTLDEAMVFLQRLDALVAITFADNAAVMASWTTARTVVGAVARKATAQPVPDSAPVPAISQMAA